MITHIRHDVNAVLDQKLCRAQEAGARGAPEEGEGEGEGEERKRERKRERERERGEVRGGDAGRCRWDYKGRKGLRKICSLETQRRLRGEPPTHERTCPYLISLMKIFLS